MLTVIASVLTASVVISPGSKVLVVGAGPVCVCAAKLAAVKGFDTTCLAYPDDVEAGPKLVGKEEMDSLPLKFMPIAGEGANEESVIAAAKESEGIIFAVDSEGAFGAGLLEIFFQSGGPLKRVSAMSRYLNGAGMGPLASASKFGANKDVWAADKKAIEGYKAMESAISQMCASAGAEYTFIRAGTLKGGANGGRGENDAGTGGESTLLTPAFYKLGQQDIVNWRLLYDCEGLGVKLVAGDTLAGPGFTAALTATDKVGSGDSHRGAVAAALVEALRAPEAANRDFSVGAEKGRDFPSDEKWASLFKAAAA